MTLAETAHRVGQGIRASAVLLAQQDGGTLEDYCAIAIVFSLRDLETALALVTGVEDEQEARARFEASPISMATVGPLDDEETATLLLRAAHRIIDDPPTASLKVEG